jgi:hypothetical protein
MLGLTSCAMVPYLLGGVAVGYGTSEVVDIFDDEGDTVLEVGEGGEVTVVNEAQELPDNAFGLLAFLLDNLWKVLVVIFAIWFIPSPAAILAKFKKWKVKRKEKKDGLGLPLD